MKRYFIIIPLLLTNCSKSLTNDEIKIIDKRDKTIDSLKTELMDCRGQAKIMAEILEKERIELQNKSY